jgi:hypothetical protein
MTPELNIDRATGALVIDSIDTPIAHGMHRDEVLRALAPFHAGGTDHRNGHEWLRFAPLKIGGHPGVAALCFFESRLASVSIGVELPDQELYEDWPTRESSQREVAFMKKFLKAQLGKKSVGGAIDMPWGVAWASFDEKGFCASAGLRYQC